MARRTSTAPIKNTTGTAGAQVVSPLRAATRQGEPVDAATLAEIFSRLRAANPEPRSDLEYLNPYTLLVAVVLSAQATDRSVNLATAPLFALADTPAAMLALGEEVVRHHIRTIGLFNTKARNVIALSRIWSRSMAARCRASARRSKCCPASAGRPRAWC